MSDAQAPPAFDEPELSETPFEPAIEEAETWADDGLDNGVDDIPMEHGLDGGDLDDGDNGLEDFEA